MAIDNGNEHVFTLGDDTKVFIGDAEISGVSHAQVGGFVADNSYWSDKSIGGSPLLPSTTTTPLMDFLGTQTSTRDEFHEVAEVTVDEDGHLIGECIHCHQATIIDVGLLNALTAQVIARLADAIGDKDVDRARVALGELAPQVREAHKALQRIDRMMAMLEKVAKVS